MATYYAEIEHVTLITVRIEMPDGHIPTIDDAIDASTYVDNVIDDWTSDGLVISIENAETGEVIYMEGD